MHILIIGLGVSGRAVRAFCEKRGDTVSVYDDVLAPDPVPLEGINLAIKSPGIAFSHPVVQAVQKRGIPLIGEIDLALREIQGKTLYAVTGSNGKTTTVLLATHLLNICGKKAAAVGNVGTPLISQIDADVEIFVVELSSFQLESITPAPYFDAGVLLNLTPNHLDRHKNFEAYAEAKLRLGECLKAGGPFFVSRTVAEQFYPSGKLYPNNLKNREFGKAGARSLIQQSGAEAAQLQQVGRCRRDQNSRCPAQPKTDSSSCLGILPIESISSLGYRVGRFHPHDLENIAAAWALTGVDQNVLEIGLETFKKPPHRIEFAREFRGIAFINDSKATSVDAVEKAVEAMQTPVVLIAGGIDKGGTYSTWLPLFRQKVRKAFVMGEAAGRMERELGSEIEIEKVADLEEGVKKAALFAKKGETVLLSPGCSSYDQFKNYEHRGDRFKEMVCALEELLL